MVSGIPCVLYRIIVRRIIAVQMDISGLHANHSTLLTTKGYHDNARSIHIGTYLACKHISPWLVKASLKTHTRSVELAGESMY